VRRGPRAARASPASTPPATSDAPTPSTRRRERGGGTRGSYCAPARASTRPSRPPGRSAMGHELDAACVGTGMRALLSGAAWPPRLPGRGDVVTRWDAVSCESSRPGRNQLVRAARLRKRRAVTSRLPPVRDTERRLHTVRRPCPGREDVDRHVSERLARTVGETSLSGGRT
jgi:hypothetical protein